MSKRQSEGLIIRFTFALESGIRTCYLDGWHTFALASDMLRSQLLKLSVFATELGIVHRDAKPANVLPRAVSARAHRHWHGRASLP